MPYLLIRQKFNDYSRWRRAFDGLALERERAGLTSVLVTRNRQDPNEAVVVFKTADLARAREHIGGEALATAWRDGGVIPDSNQVTILDEAPAPTTA